MGLSIGPFHFQRMMVFIDGTYLRACLKEFFGRDEINIFALGWMLRNELGHFGMTHSDLVRIYYYDGATDPRNDAARRKAEDLYFDRIRRMEYCEVRLGRLIPTAEGPRPKGVDVRLAIDMVAKASDGQYDTAVLLTGDDDFADVATEVRDSGKRVYGAYFGGAISDRLLNCFDRRKELRQEDLGPLMLPPASTPGSAVS